MPEGPNTFASVGTMLGLVIDGIILVVVMGIVASEIAYLMGAAQLQEARLMASSIAGVITAASSAPQGGLFCMQIPGTFPYEVAIGTETIEGIPCKSATDTKCFPVRGPPLKDVPSLYFCPLFTLPSTLKAVDCEEIGKDPKDCPKDCIPYLKKFEEAAIKENLYLPHLLGISYTESNLCHYNANGGVLDSGTGYIGIMQVTDDDPANKDPLKNIENGAHEFRRRMDAFGGDPQAAWAAYSGGEGGAAEFIKALGGADYWVANLQEAANLKLPIYDAANKIFAQMFGNAAVNTVEKQNACHVARTTSNSEQFETLGLGRAPYGFVAVLKTDVQTGGVSYMPVSNIDSQVMHLPIGQRYTILAKKTLVTDSYGRETERIAVRLRKGGLAQAGCLTDTRPLCLAS